jgi:hypothetical protein
MIPILDFFQTFKFLLYFVLWWVIVSDRLESFNDM